MAAKLRVTYLDHDRTPDVVALGAFAQIATKRRYGLDALKAEDPEVIFFGAFVELVGPPAAKSDPDEFDRWLMSVENVEVVTPEDPPTAEPTPYSGSSHDSPPTSV